MDISNGRLGFTQDLDNQKFLNALRQSNRGVTDFNAHLQQNFNQSLISVNDLAKGVTAFLTIDMARDFVTQMVKIRGEFEQLEIAFTTMLGSKEKADSLMQEIVTFAATTPFGLQSTSEATKMLLAYGESADTALDTMRKLGDIASGAGIPLKDIAYLYGTTMTQGRLYTQDLNQFLGRGIPMMDELAKILGVSKNEVKGLVEAGKVGFPEVQKVIDNLTASGSMFGGLMEAQSKSVSGQIEQLKDSVDVMFNEIGKDSQGFITDVISGASSVVENYKEIGNVLGVLITTYGAYKAALILVSTAESTHIKNSAIANESKLNNLRTTLQETEANLALAKSEDAVALSKLESVQAGLAKERIKGKELLSAIDIAHAERNQAQAVVDAAQKKYDAYKGSAFVLNEKRAAIELENAITELNTKNENVNSASKAYNTQQTKIQTLSKEAQLLTTEKSITAKTVENTQEAVNTVNKNINDLATKRLTLSQHWYALKTTLAANAQAFLNATMLSNPIVAVVAAVGALVAAYYFLADHTTAAEKAQEAYNKTQEEVKSKVDETKQKAEEYISILKDETATVYQQIEAYKALQLLKLKGFEKLSLEQVQAMDVNEIKKLVNEANDVKGLDLQKQKLSEIEGQIKSIKSQIDNVNKSNGQGGLALDGLYKKLDVLNGQYDIQLSKVSQIDREMKFANMTLDQKKAYWENIISSTERQIYTIKNVNTNQGDSLTLAQQVSNAFQNWDVSKLNLQLNEAQNQLIAINSQITSAVPEIKNKSYWEKQKNDASASRDALGVDKKGTKEWIELTKRIDEANNALQAYNDTYKKPPKAPKPKTQKKSDDPFEIYKKQIQSVKEDYERFVDYMNSDDLVLKNSGKIQYETLSKSGATYEEFLRRLQKQLVGTSNKSALQVKQLQFINDELLKTIDYNAFDKFKEGIENSISESENLLEVLGKIQEEKSKLQGNTDQISVDKFKFLDEKEIENIKKADDAAKSLIKTLTEEAYPLQTINNNFNNQFSLLKKKVLDAQQEIEKITNENNSLNPSKPESESIRVKNEETIVNLKKEVLRLQNLIDINEEKRVEATKKTPTDNANYNQLLEQYQDFETKKKNIEEKFDEDLKTVRKARKELQDNEELKANQTKLDQMLAQNTATENEILKQRKSAVSKASLEQLQGSESYIKLLTEDVSRMSIETIDKIISDLEKAMKDPKIGLEMNAQDIKVIIDQLEKLKSEAIKIRPFKSLQEGWDMFITGASVEDKLKGIDKMNQAFDQIHAMINSTLDIADSVGINVSESTRDAVQLGAELFEAGSEIAAGITSGNPVQIIQGIAKAAKSVLNFKDKKKQRQIKQYQEAVDDLARSFKNLQYETDKALGGDTYKNQRTMLDNLTKQQEEYRKMIKTEQSRKKTDNNKIKEWQQAIVELDQSKRDLLDSLAQDILQTNAKDLANTLGDALAEAFGKGEDAAKSFEKVANDVLKNAVLNQLKKRFLEDQLQGALDQLYKDMGADGKGNFEFNGLSQEEQEKFRNRLKEISKNFSGALEMYGDLFKDLEMDPNENSLSGAISGMSQETASIVAGQVNAMRLLIVEANKTRLDTNRILLQSLDRLANIDFNTKSANVILDKMYAFMQSNKDNNRSYGF